MGVKVRRVQEHRPEGPYQRVQGLLELFAPPLHEDVEDLAPEDFAYCINERLDGVDELGYFGQEAIATTTASPASLRVLAALIAPAAFTAGRRRLARPGVPGSGRGRFQDRDGLTAGARCVRGGRGEAQDGEYQQKGQDGRRKNPA
ncbi:hypothetical protein [Desulfofundulus thermosubterraneus]|uniref:hypothetical protein n=1 Tax=Desulfofundulus thermosubterraneus TaxID=348840 RepID=UPI001041F3EF|nr:hypothetical protein [Desulfofundulus thermosubterraneus]